MTEGQVRRKDSESDLVGRDRDEMHNVSITTKKAITITTIDQNLPSLLNISTNVGFESREKIVPPGKSMQQSCARNGRRAWPSFFKASQVACSRAKIPVSVEDDMAGIDSY